MANISDIVWQLQIAFRRAERLLESLRQLQHSKKLIAQQVLPVIKEHEKLLKVISAPVAQFANATAAAGSSLESLNSLRMASPAFDTLRIPNLNNLRISRFRQNFEKIAEQAILADAKWQTHIDAFQQLSNHLQTTQLALEPHFAQLVETTAAVQRIFDTVHWPQIGASFRLVESELETIRRPSLAFIESYSKLVQTFESTNRSITPQHSVVACLPPIEVYTGAELLTSLSVPKPIRLEKDSDLAQHISSDVEASLEELLLNVDPELITLWRGAKEALSSNNVDRKRHVVVSLRELLTHVLREIAPDEAIRIWTCDPKCFTDGRPTRRARILYACRTVSDGAFADFVQKDVGSAVEFIRLFQRVHERSIEFSEAQLRTLLLRTESLVRFLLAIAKTN